MPEKTVSVDGTDVRVTVDGDSAEAEVVDDKQKFIAELENNDAVMKVTNDYDNILFSYDPSGGDFNIIWVPEEVTVKNIEKDTFFSSHDGCVLVDCFWGEDDSNEYVRFTSSNGNDIVLRADANYQINSIKSLVYYDDDMCVDEMCSKRVSSESFAGGETDCPEHDRRWNFESKEIFEA